MLLLFERKRCALVSVLKQEVHELMRSNRRSGYVQGCQIPEKCPG